MMVYLGGGGSDLRNGGCSKPATSMSAEMMLLLVVVVLYYSSLIIQEPGAVGVLTCAAADAAADLYSCSFPFPGGNLYNEEEESYDCYCNDAKMVLLRRHGGATK